MSELLSKDRTPQEIEAGLDGIGALVNLHHAITGEQCPRHLAVGMATSAVSSLQFRCRALEAERDALKQDWCDHCSADLNDARHILCNEDYQRFAKALYDVENFRGRALDAAKKLQIGGLNRTQVYTMLQSLPATSERLTDEDSVVVAQQQAADLNHGD